MLFDNTINSGASPFNNVVFNGIGGVWTLTSAMRAEGDLTIASGELDVGVSNYAIAVSGNWLNEGTFTARGGTVTLDALDPGNTLNPGSSSFLQSYL